MYRLLMILSSGLMFVLVSCTDVANHQPEDLATSNVTMAIETARIETPDPATETPTMVSSFAVPTTPTATASITPLPSATVLTTQSTDTENQSNVVYSTLSEEEATKFLVDLLKFNTGCRLPCWWGITPGVTLIEDLESSFVPLGFNWNPDSHSLRDNTIYKASVDLAVEEGVVETITVRGGVNDETYDKNEAWRPFALPSLLTEYGMPAEVYVYYPFRFDPGGLASYRMFLYYPDQGIEIDYLGIASLFGDREGWAQACPDILRTDEINLFLFQPGTIPDYREVTLPAMSIPVPEQPEGVDPYDLISWEQATESTREEFFQLFTESEEGTACFSFKTYWTGS